SSRMRIQIERRGIRGYECASCRRRTWRTRDRAERTWDDLSWAEQPRPARLSATADLLPDVRHPHRADRGRRPQGTHHAAAAPATATRDGEARRHAGESL